MLRFCAFRFSFLLLLLTYCSDTGNGQGTNYVGFELYEKGNCGGWKHSHSMENSCYYFPNLEDDISGIKVPVGSCLEISDRRCGITSGSRFTIKYPNSNYCVLPGGWNDDIKSVKTCTTRTKSISCPVGTYVRRIAYKGANEGITVYCYNPLLSSANYTENTHGKTLSSPNTVACPVAAFGISASWSTAWRMYTSPSLSCVRSNRTSQESSIYISEGGKTSNYSLPVPEIEVGLNSSMAFKDHDDMETLIGNCSGVHEALSGISVVIDEADVIKTLNFNCRTVPDPSQMCEPVENLTAVVYCDNRMSGNEMECSYSKKVGVGLSTSLTEKERQDFQWNYEMGYNIGLTIDGLGISMSQKLGFSELVSYEWSRTDTTTWTEEVTVAATIKVRPYTGSRLEQLTGKCSFYGVNVNYFRQVDIDNNGTETVSYFTL